MFSLPLFWLLVLLVPSCCAVIEIGVSAVGVHALSFVLFVQWQRIWYPSFTELCIEHDRGCVDSFDFAALYASVVSKLQRMPRDWLAVDSIYSTMAREDKDGLALYVVFGL